MTQCFALLLATAIRLHADINFTVSDFDLMCRCVLAEAGGESMECKEAVATVILNRVYCDDKFPDDIEGVITQKKQFCISEEDDIPSEVKYAVVFALIKYNTLDQIIPRSCYYFRANHYHAFGIEYKHIDNTYFSLAENATD